MSARPSFIVDVNKCTGCHACAMSCQIANDLPVGTNWREVRTFNELHVPGVELMHLSLACNHCDEAPCMEQCPATAYYRDEQTGAVLINADACIGCRYCSWVCPYGAPRFDEDRGVMTKCTFCVEKQHEGEAPACVTSCPTGALNWGELASEDQVQDVPGFAQTGIGPAIRVEPLKPERVLPEMTHPPAMPPWQVLREKITPHITFKHEWTLAVFTVLVAALFGSFAAWKAGSLDLDWRLFAGLGISGMALSASHLGRRERSWRAALNLDTSWLSREIVLVGAFLGLGSAALFLPETPNGLGWLVLVMGLMTLAAIDRVYGVTIIRGSGPIHSALALGTGLLLAAALSGAWLVAGAVAFIKLILYVARIISRKKMGLSQITSLARIRLTSLVAGTVLMMLEMGWPGLALILVGELVERGEFYEEMEVPTPNSMLFDELANRPESSGGNREGIKKSTRTRNTEAQGGSR